MLAHHLQQCHPHPPRGLAFSATQASARGQTPLADCPTASGPARQPQPGRAEHRGPTTNLRAFLAGCLRIRPRQTQQPAGSGGSRADRRGQAPWTLVDCPQLSGLGGRPRRRRRRRHAAALLGSANHLQCCGLQADAERGLERAAAATAGLVAATERAGELRLRQHRPPEPAAAWRSTTCCLGLTCSTIRVLCDEALSVARARARARAR